MKIHENNTRMYLNEQVENQTKHALRLGSKIEGKKAFFSGNWNKPINGIEEKKLMAQKKALKVVGDAFSNHGKIDGDLEKRKSNMENLRTVIKESYDALDEYDKHKGELMEAYGIEPGSQEEKDLQILIKANPSSTIILGSSASKMTAEEYKRYTEIQGETRSEYQSSVLDMQEPIKDLKLRIMHSKSELYEENDIIRKVGIERLKDQSMIDAEQQKDDIMKAASNEAKGMLLGDAVDHVDEEQEKAKEESKDQAQEKKEVEKRQEDLHEKLAQMEALTEDDTQKVEKNNEDPSISLEQMSDLGFANKDVKKEVQNIVDRMNLVIEDIKGSQIDMEF